MKKVQIIKKLLQSYQIWFIVIAFLTVFYVFLAWLAYPSIFFQLTAVMLLVSFLVIVIVVVHLLKTQEKQEDAFARFLQEPEEKNEYRLCECVPPNVQPYVQKLGQCLREQQAVLEEYSIQVADYETYIEQWVHEIKIPIALMTLVLDNRNNEMSPYVQKRMQHVRNQVQQDIEQILYYARLGASHKDYFWESVSLCALCKEAVADNAAFLKESGFKATFAKTECEVFTDKKGIMFILGQILSNSIKYADKTKEPSIDFAIVEQEQQIILSISDNGTGIPASDLPFVWEKGFTGDVGSYLSRSAGMGLYLVKRMADDLAISVDIKSVLGKGVTVELGFPKVERKGNESLFLW